MRIELTTTNCSSQTTVLFMTAFHQASSALFPLHPCSCKEQIHGFHNPFGALRLVNCLAQFCPALHAVGEPRSKLFHLARRIWKTLRDQHSEVAANHLVPVGSGSNIIA